VCPFKFYDQFSTISTMICRPITNNQLLIILLFIKPVLIFYYKCLIKDNKCHRHLSFNRWSLWFRDKFPTQNTLQLDAVQSKLAKSWSTYGNHNIINNDDVLNTSYLWFIHNIEFIEFINALFNRIYATQ